MQRESSAASSFHRGSRGSPNRDTRWVEAFQAEYVDAEIFRSDSLTVERINAARLAEEMARGHGVKAVFGERVFPGEQFEPAFVNFDHQRILAAANRAIAGSQLRNIGLYFEADRPAMAIAPILPGGTNRHVPSWSKSWRNDYLASKLCATS